MPKIEQYSSGDQLIKSSSSVAANIAEGYGRYGRAEYLRFLAIANGSRCEFEARLEIYLRAKLVSPEIAEELRRESESIGQMLTRLRQRLRSRS
jgi:four helix bundle protein